MVASTTWPQRGRELFTCPKGAILRTTVQNVYLFPTEHCYRPDTPASGNLLLRPAVVEDTHTQGNLIERRRPE